MIRFSVRRRESYRAHRIVVGYLIRSMEPIHSSMVCPITCARSGFEIDSEPILGVVNLPALGELVHAARGLGCFWNGELAHVSSTSALNQALLLSTDFGDCEQYGFGPATESLQRQVQARRTWGDAYGHVLVATGRADIMLDPILNVWDCAALAPILEEAGGTFTDWNGKRTIHGGNAISTNGLLFDLSDGGCEERTTV